MSMCMHVFVHMCVSVYMYVWCTCMCLCACVCMYVSMCMYEPVCKCVYIWGCAHRNPGYELPGLSAGSWTCISCNCTLLPTTEPSLQLSFAQLLSTLAQGFSKYHVQTRVPRGPFRALCKVKTLFTSTRSHYFHFSYEVSLMTTLCLPEAARHFHNRLNAVPVGESSWLLPNQTSETCRKV